MDERKSPPRLASRKAGLGNKTHSNVITFPGTIATCECCGTHFQRRRSESWKRLCVDCWRWNKVGQALSQASRFLGDSK